MLRLITLVQKRLLSFFMFCHPKPIPTYILTIFFLFGVLGLTWFEFFIPCKHNCLFYVLIFLTGFYTTFLTFFNCIFWTQSFGANFMPSLHNLQYCGFLMLLQVVRKYKLMKCYIWTFFRRIYIYTVSAL